MRIAAYQEVSCMIMQHFRYEEGFFATCIGFLGKPEHASLFSTVSKLAWFPSILFAWDSTSSVALHGVSMLNFPSIELQLLPVCVWISVLGSLLQGVARVTCFPERFRELISSYFESWACIAQNLAVNSEGSVQTTLFQNALLWLHAYLGEVSLE